MKTILDKIVSDKRLEVERLKNEKPLSVLELEIANQSPVKSRFAARLKKQKNIKCIAEIKRRSPSKGLLRETFDPVAIAGIYQKLDCAAISVLTEENYFDGKPEYLQQVKPVVSVPLLRKDFTIDRYQIYESFLLGAEAILLIVHILTQDQLKEYITIATKLGLDCLVEVHSQDELMCALDSGANIIGINNRNLETFHTDVNFSIQFSQLIPKECIRVSESGFKTRDDIIKVDRAGFDAVLIGEQFMRSPDIPATYRNLFGK
jgi:indole-3-glycerol phosphate synthase